MHIILPLLDSRMIIFHCWNEISNGGDEDFFFFFFFLFFLVGAKKNFRDTSNTSWVYQQNDLNFVEGYYQEGSVD